MGRLFPKIVRYGAQFIPGLPDLDIRILRCAIDSAIAPEAMQNTIICPQILVNFFRREIIIKKKETF